MGVGVGLENIAGLSLFYWTFSTSFHVLTINTYDCHTRYEGAANIESWEVRDNFVRNAVVSVLIATILLFVTNLPLRVVFAAALLWCKCCEYLGCKYEYSSLKF